jgi:hypothetical protein
VHAASRTLVIHDVELLVQESEKSNLSVFQALVQILEDLLIHVVNSVLTVFAEAEKVGELLLRFTFRVKVHVKLLLQVLPRLRILRFLTHFAAIDTLIELLVTALRFLLFSEHGRAVRIYFLLFLLLGLIELFLSLFMLAELLFKDIEVSEVVALDGPLLGAHNLSHPLLTSLLFWCQHLLRLDCS